MVPRNFKDHEPNNVDLVSPHLGGARPSLVGETADQRSTRLINRTESSLYRDTLTLAKTRLNAMSLGCLARWQAGRTAS